MKIIVLTLSSLLLCLFPMKAQNSQPDLKVVMGIEGDVEDDLMHKPIPGTLVELLSTDSVVLQKTEAGGFHINGREKINLAHYGIIVDRYKKYILRFSHADYETAYLDVDLTDVRKRELIRKMPHVYLRRMMSGQIDEVTVTATKLLFYNKKDTLVFDASAFRLPEGSMLDALVKQMPGTELKDNGEIFVNGKKVDELLLNGKDFFRGNNRIMLDNLPNYMVNTINVYDRRSEKSEFLGYDTGDSKYVMDVKLKKQYSIGWLGNIEGGGGTEERYLGRLFAMRFTDHSQVSLYANVNNVNEDRKPGSNGNWTPAKVSGGELTTRMAGVNYAIDDRNHRFKLSGNAQVSHTDNELDSHSDRMNFLQAGNTYDRILNQSRNKNLMLTTEHDFNFQWERTMLTLKPKFNYRKYDNENAYSSAAADTEISGYGQEILDQLFQPEGADTLRRLLINRNLQNNLGSGSTWNGGLEVGTVFKMKYSPDALSLNASANFKGGDAERFARNRVDYYRGQTASSTDFRNQYWRNTPAEGYNYKLRAEYDFDKKPWPLWTFRYQYEQKYESRDAALYRLDWLSGWGADSEHAIGTLPSETEYLNTLDVTNSYDSRQWDKIHEVGIWLNWNKRTEKGKWWSQVRPTLSFQDSRMNHQQAQRDTVFTRKTVLFNLVNSFIQWNTYDNKHTVALFYDVNTQAPDMQYLLTVRNDADPLNVTTGNPNLKNPQRHNYSLSYNYRKNQRQIYARVEQSFTRNAIAMGYLYDKQTGVRSYRPENVNGNWDATADFRFFTPLDKQRRFELSNFLTGRYIHSVDLSGTGTDLTDRLSKVNTFRLTDQLSLKFRTDKLTVGAMANASWNNSRSDREDFTDIDALDLRYGLTLQWQLLYKWQFNTDLTMYTRRGYGDESMNTDDLVWNAQITRPFFKNRLQLTVDGFDILRQLSNVTRVLNAQARVETYTNVIPRYLMVHLTYRLNIQPKKRGK